MAITHMIKVTVAKLRIVMIIVIAIAGTIPIVLIDTTWSRDNLDDIVRVRVIGKHALSKRGSSHLALAVVMVVVVVAVVVIVAIVATKILEIVKYKQK